MRGAPLWTCRGLSALAENTSLCGGLEASKELSRLASSILDASSIDATSYVVFVLDAPTFTKPHPLQSTHWALVH